MYYIEQLTEYSFQNPELLTRIKSQADDLIDHLMAPEAYQMALELEAKLKELAGQGVSQPQIFAQYRRILIRLKFISLSLWDENTFLNLIKNNLADILGSDIDINERMTGKLYMVPEMAWPEITQYTIEILRQNVQPIGNRQMIIPGEKVVHPPLIKYWLLDYDRSLGMERHENIQRAKYFTDSRNFLGLNETEKLKVQQLLEFYDGLRPLPLPEEEIRPKEEGAPTIAIPRQKGEEGGFTSGEEEAPEFPYPGQVREPNPASYQPPAKPAIPSWQKAQQPPPSPPPPGALPTGTPPPPAAPQAQSKDTYREQVAPQDLAGPQAAQRPAPKLNGNVINLKDFGSGQQ